MFSEGGEFMLSIGEFSNICKVSTKTLRYYAKIGLIIPDKIDSENGYRYYSIDQLETMLFINRLKSYNFSLEEIKMILNSEESRDKILYLELLRKKTYIENQINNLNNNLAQLNEDIFNLKHDKSIMSYMENIDVQLVEVPAMNILSIRKMVHQNDIADEYENCFSKLIKRIQNDSLTIISPPMVLFHNDEFSSFGLDIEFAIPIKESITGTRFFHPDLCLKTVLYGSYSNLTSVYTKHRKWSEKNGYESNNALFEIYVTAPSQVSNENELITEIYYPVRKKI
jgi:DNA-binding transcriptional MerR regulator